MSKYNVGFNMKIGIFIVGAILVLLLLVFHYRMKMGSGLGGESVDSIVAAGKGLLDRNDAAMRVYFSGNAKSAEVALVNFLQSNSALPKDPNLQVYKFEFEITASFRLQFVRAYLYGEKINFCAIRSLYMDELNCVNKPYADRGFEGILKSNLDGVVIRDAKLCPWINDTLISQAEDELRRIKIKSEPHRANQSTVKTSVPK